MGECLLRGIERRAYHLPTPDPGQMLLMDSMVSLSPGVLPLPLTLLVQGIARIVLVILRWNMDRVARKCNATTA